MTFSGVDHKSIFNPGFLYCEVQMEITCLCVSDALYIQHSLIWRSKTCKKFPSVSNIQHHQHLHKKRLSTGRWFKPLWKNISQLGLVFHISGKTNSMFQTTNQKRTTCTRTHLSAVSAFAVPSASQGNAALPLRFPRWFWREPGSTPLAREVWALGVPQTHGLH